LEVETRSGVLDDDEKIEGDDEEVEKGKLDFAAESLSDELLDPASAGLIAARGAWKTLWGLSSDCVNSVCFPIM